MKSMTVCAIAQVRFTPNLGARKDGRGRKPSTYVGYYGTAVVFSSAPLEEFIFQHGVTDTELDSVTGIWVALKRHHSYFEAWPLPNSLPIRGSNVIVERKRVAVFIDGQNYLLSIREAGIQVRPSKLIELIAARYDTRVLLFYISPNHDVGERRLISDGDLKKIEQLPAMRVIRKNYHENGNGKGNIDHLLVEGLVRTYSEMPGLEGAVLVGGDGDYQSALNLWSIGDGKGGPKFVEVISGKKALSSSLANDESISVVYLEDLCSNAAAV